MAVPQHVIQSVQLLVQTSQREKALALERERFEFEKEQSAQLMKLQFAQLTAERKKAEAEMLTKELELQQKQMQVGITEGTLEANVYERAERAAMLGLPSGTPYSGLSSLDDMWRQYNKIREPLSGDAFLSPDAQLQIERQSGDMLAAIRDRTERVKNEIAKFDTANPATAAAAKRLARHSVEVDRLVQPGLRNPTSEEVYGAPPKGSQIGPADKPGARVTVDEVQSVVNAWNSAKSPSEQAKVRNALIEDFQTMRSQFGDEQTRLFYLNALRATNMLGAGSDVQEMMAEAYQTRR